MPIRPRHLAPGTRLRWDRGHHVGSVVEVVKDNGLSVQLRIIGAQSRLTGKRRGRERAYTVNRNRVLAQCSLVRPRKGK